MFDKVLIINGVDNLGELSKFGNFLAKLYEESDIIYFITKNGNAIQAKYKKGQDLSVVKYFDAYASKDLA